jgi:hypothetical protein
MLERNKMDEYSLNKSYWHIRQPVEIFFNDVSGAIPNIETLIAELQALEEQILKKNETIRFKCTYLFRKDQNLIHCDGDRGDYIDTWYRSCQFNMQIVNDDGFKYEDHPPMPDKPIEVVLGPGMSTQAYCREFTECWHPNCLHYTEDHPIRRSRVIYMFCKDHADVKIIDVIREHVINGKVIEDENVKAIVENVRHIIETRVLKTLTEAIYTAKKLLEKEDTPDKVIAVHCTAYEEEVTYYIDLVKCERYLRHQDE